MIKQGDRISIRVSAELKETLQALADKSEMTLSSFIIMKLKEMLESRTKFVKTKYDDE